MKTLTTQTAKQLAEKYLRDPSDIDPYHFIHTTKVVEAAGIISQGRTIDKTVLEICAWLHDIGYFVGNLANNDPRHKERSIDLLIDEGYEVTSTIRDCILNHDSSGHPSTREGMILQIAVKFSIIDSSFLRYLIDERADGKEVDFLKARTDAAVGMLKTLKSLNF